MIYFLERNERYIDAVRPLFEAADRGDVRLVTSSITLLEILVVPYRAGDSHLAARYEQLLTRSRGGCFLTNDRRLPDLPGLPVFQLAGLL